MGTKIQVPTKQQTTTNDGKGTRTSKPPLLTFPGELRRGIAKDLGKASKREDLTTGINYTLLGTAIFWNSPKGGGRQS